MDPLARHRAHELGVETDVGGADRAPLARGRCCPGVGDRCCGLGECRCVGGAGTDGRLLEHPPSRVEIGDVGSGESSDEHPAVEHVLDKAVAGE
ncbi:hypothetical protein DEJ27_11950 [Curtobacterium sp. MCPF17_018]|nr:hypothetical protein DEJ27_11950 [Curtobacterium sp. MCPF17_018]